MSNYESDIEQAELQRVSDMFKALSNPHRLRIYRILAGCCQEKVLDGPVEEMQKCQREFAEELELAPSTVSHHFKELRQAGLLHMERQGKNVRFWVDNEAAQMVRKFFDF